MLEKIDLNKKVDKKNYKEAMDKAGERLGLLQRECKAEGIPVMIVFEGMGAAGKGVQNQPADSGHGSQRVLTCMPATAPTRRSRCGPFCGATGPRRRPKGRFAIFDRSWYRSVQVDRFDGLTPEDKVGGAYQDILSFEKQLSDDGTVIIKFFLYIDKEEQKKALQEAGRLQGDVLAGDKGGLGAEQGV